VRQNDEAFRKPFRKPFDLDGERMFPHLHAEADATGGLRLSGGPLGSHPVRPARWVTAHDRGDAPYDVVRETDGALVAEARIEEAGLRVVDTWRVIDGGLGLSRRIEAEPGEPVRVDLEISTLSEEGDRYFLPGMISAPGQHASGSRRTFSEDRLGYPLVALWRATEAEVVWLARTNRAAYDTAPIRELGDTIFRRDTDLGHLGFRRAEPALLVGWPVAELDTSSQLDARGTGFEALHGRETGLELTLEYELRVEKAPSFAEAVRIVTARAVALAAPRPTGHDTSLEDSVRLRLDSAARTYTETATGFAGFVLNFDPERGYDSQAKAFGASFADHQMGGSHGILEYGFTGRQLDLACSLAARDPEAWAERGRRVVDSFVDRLVHESGWTATLYDLAEDRPLFAIGDARGTVMHYLGVAEIAGTYTRMMTEAGGDLVRNIELHERRGAEVPTWRAAALGLARFLTGVQNADGSWYRAYAPDGTPIVGDAWFGDRESSGKSATAAVVPYLLAVAAIEPSHAPGLRESAARAGRFVLGSAVARAEYRGGTLDNPNDVDKEAAFLAMRALLALADAGVAGEWTDGAVQSAWFALGWHSLVEVPTLAGTPVGEAGVRSVGWGGINSVWGVGVTDIYSLFFAGELHRLGDAQGIREFVQVAELIAHSSLELLSMPGQLHGFADAGMQPEGIAFCDQGRDDGLIRKGDTWGGLGWPYTAGTTGMADYLAARAASDHR
jgi:hypothetical protein